MKIYIAVILLLALVGCGQSGEEIDIPDTNPGDVVYYVHGQLHHEQVHGHMESAELRFSSLEEFLHTYIAVRDGISAEGFMPESLSGHFDIFSEMVAGVDLLSLEKLYLPTALPEGYQIFEILLSEWSVSLFYLHEEHLISEFASFDAVMSQQHFQFWFPRRSIEPPVEIVITDHMRRHGITEDDIIDGTYLYLHFINSIDWVFDNMLMSLGMPQSFGENYSIEELLAFTATEVLDLTDEDAINALLG